VNTNSYTHEHKLWALCDLSVNFEEIRLFQSLETKVVQVKVAIVDHCSIELVFVLDRYFVGLLANKRGWGASLGVLVVVEIVGDLRECLGRLLVKIRNGNAGS
jgi:hypothetical protein